MFQLYASDSEAQYEMAEIVFTTFDHSITDAEAMKLKRIGLAQLVKVRICRAFPHFSPHDVCVLAIVMLGFTSNSNIVSFLVFILMLLMFLGSAGQQVVRRGI